MKEKEIKKYAIRLLELEKIIQTNKDMNERLQAQKKQEALMDELMEYDIQHPEQDEPATIQVMAYAEQFLK